MNAKNFIKDFWALFALLAVLLVALAYRLLA